MYIDVGQVQQYPWTGEGIWWMETQKRVENQDELEFYQPKDKKYLNWGKTLLNMSLIYDST